jgi:hypothetical protein
MKYLQMWIFRKETTAGIGQNNSKKILIGEINIKNIAIMLKRQTAYNEAVGLIN